MPFVRKDHAPECFTDHECGMRDKGVLKLLGVDSSDDEEGTNVNNEDRRNDTYGFYQCQSVSMADLVPKTVTRDERFIASVCRKNRFYGGYVGSSAGTFCCFCTG